MSWVAQKVKCLAKGWTTGQSRFEPQQMQKEFSCSLCVQTVSGAHPASCTMGTERPFPGAKARLERDSDLSSIEVDEWGLYRIFSQAPPWRVVGQF
jgi:hypothetical protein